MEKENAKHFLIKNVVSIEYFKINIYRNKKSLLMKAFLSLDSYILFYEL